MTAATDVSDLRAAQPEGEALGARERVRRLRRS